MNEEKKEEDLLNKCMQSMSIEEQGEHLMWIWQSCLVNWWGAKGGEGLWIVSSFYIKDSIVIHHEVIR